MALVMLSVHVFAQTNLITASISSPANPDADLSKWGTGASVFMISARSQSANGKIDPLVGGSRILLTVKQNGKVVCGAYTSKNAPPADFNTSTKIWSGPDAASLIGKDCILPAGDYELSVQFFGDGAAGVIPLSDEKIKPFTIRGKDQEAYQPLHLVFPADGSSFKDADTRKPLTFRWTPPGSHNPQQPVTYLLSVWELREGQTGTQAMKANIPTLTKNVENITQATVTNLITGPILAPYTPEFVWTVTVVNKDGKGYGPATGASEVFKFNFVPEYIILKPFTVTGIWPNASCATTDPRPVFNWELGNVAKKEGITHELTVIELPAKDTSLDDFDKKKPLFVKSGIKADNFKLPASSPALVMGKIYAWRVRSFQDGKLAATSDPNFFYINSYHLPYDITAVTCCTTSLVTNGSFKDGNVAGVLGSGGAVTDWHAGYGSPTVSSNVDGYKESGYVQIKGSKLSGSSIAQTFPAQNGIVMGKHYRVSLAVRLTPGGRNSKYALIKVIAYNGALPTTGLHPTPSSTLAIVGFTGKLTLNEWGLTSLNIWTPNKNFNNLAVYCYTNGDSTAVCDIDDICVSETKESQSCDDYSYTSQGQPVLDTTIANHARDTTYNYYDEYTGLTSDLYSQQGNTAVDNWYPSNDPCSSIGGSLPPGVTNINFADTLHSLGYPGTPGSLDTTLSQTVADTSTQRSLLTPIQPITSVCAKTPVLNNNLPFGGRDIIFVHGLQLRHLCDRLNHVPGAGANWPTDAAAFYAGGYYKNIAESGWADHIKTWLTNRGYKNRYLIVAYDCSQRLPVAVHCMLKQIRDAMNDGTGVVFDPSDPRKSDCFGRSSVIISHSTGGLVTDVAMSIANKSKTDPALQATYGNVGFISDNVAAHVAFHPVLEGSRMASIFLAAQISLPIGTLLNSEICSGLTTISPQMFLITHSSILIDLQPGVVRNVWAPYINSTPVPTITVAGGHPLGVDGVGVLNWVIHPGLDDGVSTMSSQTGNPNDETGILPSGYFYSGINPFRVFDMGIPVQRAVSYYMNQTLFTAPHYVGGASITNLSPTGMVQPVGSVLNQLSCENRYYNHYSFIQTASDHYKGPRGKSFTEGFIPSDPTTSGYQPPNYDYAPMYGKRNYEESRAITDMGIYTRGLVSNAVATMQAEHIRGLYITIAIPIPNFSIKCCPFKFKFWWSYYYINITIWERKYHNMVGYETEDECSYVYKYVLHQ